MSDFPNEALPAIFSQLHGSDLRTLLSLLSVSKVWQDTALADTRLWTSIIAPPSVAPKLTNAHLQAALRRAQHTGFESLDLTGCVQLSADSLDAIVEECHHFPQRLSLAHCPQLHWTHVLDLLEKLQKTCGREPPVLSNEVSESESNESQHPPEAASQSQSYLEVPGGVVRNPDLPGRTVLLRGLEDATTVSGRQAPRLVRPELRLKELRVAGIDFQRCKWRQLRQLMQYTEQLDVGECEDEHCFQIRTVHPCASCLSECCEQHLYTCHICGGRTCRSHCFSRAKSDGEGKQGVCYRCHVAGLQTRLVHVQTSLAPSEGHTLSDSDLKEVQISEAQ